MNEAARYVGRFAPSPSGPLHFGSLLAACASYLQALCANGHWLLRIENIDPPREQAGAAVRIVHALETYGFQWHGPIIYQSTRTEAHEAAAAALVTDGQAYHCGCSRRDLQDAPLGALGPIYPGTCRSGTTADEFAVRVRTHNEPICFADRLQGRHCQTLQVESGDFIIRRRDGLIAYHLAVVVDDAFDEVTEVVRGIDLLDSTPRHIHLQQLLGLPTPRYMHIPVIENEEGQKLSKLTGAPPLPEAEPRPVLVAALGALQLPVFDDLAASSIVEIWDWARANWQASRLAGLRRIANPSPPMAGP